MNWLIPNRQHVAQLKYQLRKFENQCADLPASAQLQIHQSMQALRSLLSSTTADDCSSLGGHHSFDRPPYSKQRRCTRCDVIHPDDVVQSGGEA